MQSIWVSEPAGKVLDRSITMRTIGLWVAGLAGFLCYLASFCIGQDGVWQSNARQSWRIALGA